MALNPNPAPGSQARQPEFLITMFALCLFAVMIILLMFRDIPAGNREIVAGAIGFMSGTLLAGAIGWWFGSSKGSQAKDDRMADLADRSSSVTVTPPEKPAKEGEVNPQPH